MVYGLTLDMHEGDSVKTEGDMFRSVRTRRPAPGCTCRRPSCRRTKPSWTLSSGTMPTLRGGWRRITCYRCCTRPVRDSRS